MIRYIILIFSVCAFFMLGGCTSVDYSKIPLQAEDVPYILKDGDYEDIEGNIHYKQHNVWAMGQSDVYDYMMHLKDKSKKSRDAEVLSQKYESVSMSMTSCFEKYDGLDKRCTNLEKSNFYIIIFVIFFTLGAYTFFISITKKNIK